MSQRSDTVSFRLPGFFNQLAKESERRGFESPHDYARKIVIDSLTDASAEEHRRELAELRKSLETLRVDLATATACMLAFAGKWDPEKAKTWAKESLLGGKG